MNCKKNGKGRIRRLVKVWDVESTFVCYEDGNFFLEV